MSDRVTEYSGKGFSALRGGKEIRQNHEAEEYGRDMEAKKKGLTPLFSDTADGRSGCHFLFVLGSNFFLIFVILEVSAFSEALEFFKITQELIR